MKVWDVTEARARQTDPETSHEAARLVKGRGPVHDFILKILGSYGARTDEELVVHAAERYIKASESGLRTRRCELVKLGKVEDSGDRRTLQTGRKAVVWRLREER